LAAKLLEQFKRRISELALEPSTGGCFELTVGNELIYSKLQTGRFPDEATLAAEVGKRLKS
jgi:selenoprotein W-related protein